MKPLLPLSLLAALLLSGCMTDGQLPLAGASRYDINAY